MCISRPKQHPNTQPISKPKSPHRTPPPSLYPTVPSASSSTHPQATLTPRLFLDQHMHANCHFSNPLLPLKASKPARLSHWNLKSLIATPCTWYKKIRPTHLGNQSCAHVIHMLCNHELTSHEHHICYNPALDDRHISSLHTISSKRRATAFELSCMRRCLFAVLFSMDASGKTSLNAVDRRPRALCGMSIHSVVRVSETRRVTVTSTVEIAMCLAVQDSESGYFNDQALHTIYHDNLHITDIRSMVKDCPASIVIDESQTMQFSYKSLRIYNTTLHLPM